MPKLIHLYETARRPGHAVWFAVCGRRVSVLALTSDRDQVTCPKCRAKSAGPVLKAPAPVRRDVVQGDEYLDQLAQVGAVWSRERATYWPDSITAAVVQVVAGPVY